MGELTQSQAQKWEPPFLARLRAIKADLEQRGILPILRSFLPILKKAVKWTLYGLLGYILVCVGALLLIIALFLGFFGWLTPPEDRHPNYAWLALTALAGWAFSFYMGKRAR